MIRAPLPLTQPMCKVVYASINKRTKNTIIPTPVCLASLLSGAFHSVQPDPPVIFVLFS